MPRAAGLPGSKADIGPGFPVHMLEGRVDHREMAVAKPRLRYRRFEGFHFLRLRIEPNDLHLRHVAEVNPPLFIDVDLETALSDLAQTILWNRVLDRFAGHGI